MSRNEPAKPELNERSRDPITIVDVARAAGVSHSTVSRVLNGRPYIKDETRQRVLATLDRLGYVANLKARGLAGGRLGVIGLVVLDLDSSYILQVVRGVDAALADNGWDLMLCTTHRREQREASYVSRLSMGLVDGLIVLLPLHYDRYARQLAEKQFPFVLLDHAGSRLANSVIAQNRAGAREAVEHLAGLGHQRVAVITGDLAVTAGLDRLTGYRDAVKEFGLDDDPALVVTGDFLETGGYAGMRRLLDLDRPPSAVFASSDTAAFGAMRAVSERGLTVPADVSVVGFDDVPEAVISAPPLTTLRQPMREMGHRAVQLLLDTIEAPGRAVSHAEFAVELVVRESTAPPRS